MARNVDIGTLWNKYFPKVTGFKKGQDIIWDKMVNSNDDLLYVLPTGYGKSLLFQMYACAEDHWGMVISPLISLMNDQVNKVMFPAATVHSEIDSREKRLDIVGRAANGEYKLLFISPERLTSISLQAIMENAKKPPSFIVVDEAHCLSEWGRDFRLNYLRIRELANRLKVRLFACTATANTRLRLEIAKELDIDVKNILKPVEDKRDNLRCILKPSNTREEAILSFKKDLPRLVKKGPGMLFVVSPVTARDLSMEFGSKYKTDWYGGVDAKDENEKTRTAKERQRVQKQWINDEIEIIFCTSAFGLGIDKPNVRWVAHLELPQSLEAYWQQIGRAGRDGAESFCIVYSCNKEYSYYNRQLKSRYKDSTKLQKMIENMCEDDYCHVSTNIPKNKAGDLQTRQLLAWVLSKHKILDPLFEYVSPIEFEVVSKKGVTINGRTYNKGLFKWRASDESDRADVRAIVLDIFYQSIKGNVIIDSREERHIELRFIVNKIMLAKNMKAALNEIRILYEYKMSQINKILMWNTPLNKKAKEAIYKEIK